MTKIKDLKENEKLKQNLLLTSFSKGITNKGATYLNLVFQDDTGMIDGKLWDAKQSDIDSVVEGHVELVTFEVLEYNKKLQLRVNQIEDLDQSTIDLREYVMSSSTSKEEFVQRFEKMVNSIQNETYRTLVEGMLNKAGEKFFEYPAASRIHHSYYSGLAEHTLGMALLAHDVCKYYPLLDRDLLLSGVIIHDMGKIAELGGIISSQYSLEGKMTGHISIGHGWLMEVSKELGLEDREETILLRHMILSHHGKLEYGSPILPHIPEAEILSMIDNMDARLNTLNLELANIQPGEWSNRIFSLDNRQFYKPKYRYEEEE